MPTEPPSHVAFCVQTDVGRVREHNEDSAYADPAGAYFIVADGMGGHAAGEVASAMAVDEIKTALDAVSCLHSPVDQVMHFSLGNSRPWDCGKLVSRAALPQRWIPMGPFQKLAISSHGQVIAALIGYTRPS